MIEVTSSTAFMLYLCLTLGSIFGLWIYQHYGNKKKTIYSNEQKLRICEYCHFAYLEESVKDVNKCPQCGSFNKNNQYGSQGTARDERDKRDKSDLFSNDEILNE